MAKQANRMMIGVFVVVAVTLMAASLVIFGSGKFFKKTNKYVMYFNESIKGLNVGAPVLFKGVQIGAVSSIVILADPEKLETRIPVVIEVDPEQFQIIGGARGTHGGPGVTAARMVEKGLRGVLSTQSFITGQLAIELDFYSTAKLCYAPPQVDESYKGYMVIPTCESTAQRLLTTMEKMDLEGVIKKLDSSLAGIDRLVNDKELTASIRSLNNTLQDARKLVNRLDRQVDPVAGDLKKTVSDIGKLARNADAQVGAVTTSLDKTMAAARGALSEDSPLLVTLENTLHEISAMSRSIRQLSSYFEQHPEALIRGKGKPGGKE
jgi:paraquat-inducible protein B